MELHQCNRFQRQVFPDFERLPRLPWWLANRTTTGTEVSLKIASLKSIHLDQFFSPNLRPKSLLFLIFSLSTAA